MVAPRFRKRLLASYLASLPTSSCGARVHLTSGARHRASLPSARTDEEAETIRRKLAEGRRGPVLLTWLEQLLRDREERRQRERELEAGRRLSPLTDRTEPACPPCDTCRSVTPRLPARRGDDSLGLTFTIVLGTDEFGSIPLLLHEEDALPGGAFRWRVVAQTDDPVEARRVVELLNRRCFSEPPDAV